MRLSAATDVGTFDVHSTANTSVAWMGRFFCLKFATADRAIGITHKPRITEGEIVGSVFETQAMMLIGMTNLQQVFMYIQILISY